MTANKKVPDFVYVQMIFNDPKKHDVIMGLFKGILEYKGQTYIALKGVGSSTTLLNLEFYNVMMIDALEEEYNNMAFLTHEKEDQEKALLILQDYYKTYQQADYMLKKGGMLIDVDRFINVPDKYQSGKEITKSVSSGTGTYSEGHSRYQQGATKAAAYSETKIKPEPVPAVFKRTSKKPTKVELQALAELIDQIASKEVVLPLKETPADDVGDDDDDGYDNIYGNMYG